ncbi:MAG: hypothetical protein JNM17_21550 [Archangium sp.]|nr:hypothetical protein [Archangium sp.]
MKRGALTLTLALMACVPSYTGAPCASDDNCPTGQICETGRCDYGARPPGTCRSETQPGGCGYGSVCTSANSCQAITEGQCTHIGNTFMSMRSPWTSTSTGPVIFNVIDEVDVAADCASDNAFTMTVYAYSTFVSFPTDVNALPALRSYGSLGTPTELKPRLLQTRYTVFNDGGQVGVTFTLCAPSTRLELGLAFEGGNGVCTTQTR